MKKLYISALWICTTAILYSQDVILLKDIKFSTQDFLSQVTQSSKRKFQYLVDQN